MKVTLTIELEGGMELPISADIATLADVKKLGTKLACLPAGANKLIPGTADRKVVKLRLPKEKSESV